MNSPTNPANARFTTLQSSLIKGVSLFLFIGLSFIGKTQAVTSIITDYNGWWKSSAVSPNAVKPDNSHNLLAFTYNGKQYSTGVNNELLSARGETFIAGDFWSLPVNGLTGTINSNTKVGLGAMYDGVYNGAGTNMENRGIDAYLTDGIKGLNLGTCIANLPVGTMGFYINNVKPSAIGDGIPDIIVTQIADPSGNSFDRYQFTDANGAVVGISRDIIFTNIVPVGTWTADFYEATTNPMKLTGGFTQTDRPVRIWGADLSEFGITQANYSKVQAFKINLCGNSDVAFVAYNNSSVSFRNTLPVEYSFFKGSASTNGNVLSWETSNEINSDKFIIERSKDGRNFSAIDSVRATNENKSTSRYQFIDKNFEAGTNYYRLRQLDVNGKATLSAVIKIENGTGSSASAVRVFPIPARTELNVTVQNPSKNSQLIINSSTGIILKKQSINSGSAVSTVDIRDLRSGIYFITIVNGDQKTTQRFVVG